jgi:hypothetical protein
MVMILDFSGPCVHDMVIFLQPNKTYTIGSVDGVDIRINSNGVDAKHASIRYTPRTGECTLKCLKEFRPPETSGLWLQNEHSEMDPITEKVTILRNGSDFSIGDSWAANTIKVWDPAFLIKEKRDLEYGIEQLKIELLDARREIDNLKEELRGEQLRRERVGEELSVEGGKGDASGLNKCRK